MERNGWPVLTFLFSTRTERSIQCWVSPIHSRLIAKLNQNGARMKLITIIARHVLCASLVMFGALIQQVQAKPVVGLIPGESTYGLQMSSSTAEKDEAGFPKFQVTLRNTGGEMLF